MDELEFIYCRGNWQVKLDIMNDFTRFNLTVLSKEWEFHQYFGDINIDKIEEFLPTEYRENENLAYFFLTKAEIELVKEWVIDASIPLHIKRDEIINKLLSEK
jgi:hypothetical protein